MSTSAIHHYRWSRSEYDRMIAAGIFHPEARLELIDGEIFHMTPQGSLHATAIRLVEEALRSVFTKNFDVRVQMPLALDDRSEPEPDLAVVPGRPRDYRYTHPTHAVLVVEIADTTLAFDREQKLKLYARNELPEYWILNIHNQQLEINRNPVHDGYQNQLILSSGDRVSALAQPQASIRIADLLP